MQFVNIQITIPQTVGIKNEIIVHFMLPVSFFIVINVVLHGKCNTVNIITLIAVKIVQPFCLKISPSAKVSSISTNTLDLK